MGRADEIICQPYESDVGACFFHAVVVLVRSIRLHTEYVLLHRDAIEHLLLELVQIAGAKDDLKRLREYSYETYGLEIRIRAFVAKPLYSYITGLYILMNDGKSYPKIISPDTHSPGKIERLILLAFLLVNTMRSRQHEFVADECSATLTELVWVFVVFRFHKSLHAKEKVLLYPAVLSSYKCTQLRWVSSLMGEGTCECYLSIFPVH
jgi:hypothetical protein